MVTLGWLIDLMEDAVTDDTEDTGLRIVRSINQAWFQTCGSRDWEFLKRTVKPSVTSLTEDVPIVLPANFVKMVGTVVDGTEDRYYFSPHRNRGPFKHILNWYHPNPVSDYLAKGTSIAVGQNSTSLTSADAEFPASDAGGEFIRIGENLGMYEIDTWTSTSAMTITQAFRGKEITEGDDTYFEVRPVGTKRINFCDGRGTFVSPGTPEITYRILPLPLYNRWDAVDLPGDSTLVFLKSLKSVANQKGWTRVGASLDRDFLIEMGNSMRQEPTNQEAIKPSGRFKFHSRTTRWGW